MLHHQDRPLNSTYEGKEGTSCGSSSSLQNGKGDTDGNFNFLPGEHGDGIITMGSRADENRNQMRPHNLGLLGHDPSTCSPTSGFHYSTAVLSPRSRLTRWSPLEPLPEIDSGDDGYGRVPPDGVEEGRVEDEEDGRLEMMTKSGQREKVVHQKRNGSIIRGEEEDEDDEWGDSDSESEHSQSGGSMSSLNTESGGEGLPKGGWHHTDQPESKLQESNPTRKWDNCNPEPTGRSGSISQTPATGHGSENCEQSSDSDGELPEIMDGIWTLLDRERFKVQEMEKHQVQLTMYRRLALIRWVRTLQGRVQEQQNRLQSSFDIILTHRKELLRMSTAAAVANVTPATAISQS
ncbi:UPF0500 protein C1orf216 homolog [Thalassophryne amazonica]|uniref:UPF0500 protein C1orf216 homolog n=1 Tax=Thalassophryne amazonica TaxID=390379 RepID=UPI0014718BB0|nr:UPF0500 protein C1orf216 homolog [Thalassophryne amazonica]